MEFKTVFDGDGNNPANFYRIPSMVTTKNGVVVACADARYCSGMDNPNRIDKVVRRSVDSGNTWGDYIIAVEEHGTKQMFSSAGIDPVLTYVPEINRIYLHYCHTPAGVGIRNSLCCVGENSDGDAIINGIAKKYILKNGALFNTNGKPTKYKVDCNGNVLKNNKKVGNIYTGKRFRQAHTSFLMVCYSDDEGLTWSKPKSLNYQLKKDYMSFIGPGPGNGIVVKNGKYKGRIVVPIYYGTRIFPLRLSSCVIYSDDGINWKLGNSPNNTRVLNSKTLNDKTIKNDEMLTESQLIEQDDGTLKVFMRNHDKSHTVAVAYSHNGGESWQDFSLDENLPQPICQTSVIKFEYEQKNYVVLLNASDKNSRSCGTVRLSEDDGETFAYSRVLKNDDFVYSSLTHLPDGNIGALFEPDSKCKKIMFTKFSLDWIKGKD